MQISRMQRGFALITVLGILGLFLLVCLVILIMTSQNSQNVGNAYQKQRYYDVAEAGVDRGLRDLDTSAPAPGTVATPGPVPSPPAMDQTPLPNVPNVPYHYSYWYNSGPAPVATLDPLAGSQFGVSANHQVQIPAYGALIWSYTTTGVRDVAVETVVSRFAEATTSCAICAGKDITVTGSQNFTVPPGVCGSAKNPDKICSDPNASPSPYPTSVPIVSGGSYTCSGAAAQASPCAFGDGSSTPSPSKIQQNASPGVTSGFLASQGTIDQLANAGAWQALAGVNSNVKFINCPTGCDAAALALVAPAVGQVTFVNGDISMSSKTVLTYGGLIIVSGCLTISQPGMQGTSNTAIVIVLGTDTQCGGMAVTMQGGGNTKPPLWNSGTLYAAQGSVNIAGNGSVKGYNFYGAIIAAGSVTITGNGYFAWESALKTQALSLGPFAIDSFAQY